MKNTISFTTSSGNVYLYSPFRNQVLLCHPLIPLFFNADLEGITPSVFLKNHLKGNSFTTDDSGTFSAHDARIQFARYRFLKRHGYFRSVKPVNLEGRLVPSKVDENLSSIQQIIFESTEACNLDCTYCIYSKFYINQKRGTKEFDIRQARLMLSYILDRRAVTAPKDLIISFYGGEPLKNIRFIRQVVEFCQLPRYKEINFRFSMTTNGLLLARHAQFLSDHNMEVSISLDGDSQANQYRILKNNKPSYNLVVQNIDTLRKQYPDYFNKHISFLTVLHNQNTYESVFRFFQERYNKTPLISAINTIDINADYFDEFKETFIRNKREETSVGNPASEMFMNHPGVRELSDILEKYSGFVFKNYYEVLASRKSTKRVQQFIPTATCQPFSMRVYLTADGSILPCEHISRIFTIGALDSDKVTIKPEEIAASYNRYFEKITTLCNHCLIADHCKECIFNTRIETDKPVCDFFTDEAKFIKEMGAALSMVEQEYPLYQRILKEAFHGK